MSSIEPWAPSKRNCLPASMGAVQFRGDVFDHRSEAVGVGKRVIDHLLGIKRFGLEVIFQNEVVQFENRTDTLGKHGRLIEVSDTHAAARDLVFIGGPVPRPVVRFFLDPRAASRA